MLQFIIPIVLLLLTIGAYFYMNKSKTSSSSKKSSTKSSDTLLAEQELSKLSKKNNDTTQGRNNDKNNGQRDVNYLLTNLHPTKSTHLDVLLLIATTPENINMTKNAMENEQKVYQQKYDLLHPEQQQQKEEEEKQQNSSSSSNNNNNLDFDLDGSWGDDEEDENDEQIQANKKRQAEKEKLAQEVATASGRNTNSMLLEKVKIEGLDEGVLGQKWVEKTLSTIGQFTPQVDLVLDECSSSSSSGKRDLKEWMDEDDAVRRNICMTMGRLNSQALNTHPELVEAGPKQLIDTIYFQASMEYRKRTIILLEAAIRMIGPTRSHKLYQTLVECYTMFKLGVPSFSDTTNITNFQKQMEKAYGGPQGVPRLIVSKLDITTPNEKEIVNDDTSALELELNRVHCEAFMKQKIAMAMKQGIPPEIALQTYREGWWILLRSEKLDGDNDESNYNIDEIFEKHPMLASISIETKNKFKEVKSEDRLINAWPFVVTNMKQQVGKVKVRFAAPKVPGKYKFHIDVKSQEYLGCDQTFTLEKEILDKDLVVRAEKKEGEEEKEKEGGN